MSSAKYEGVLNGKLYKRDNTRLPFTITFTPLHSQKNSSVGMLNSSVSAPPFNPSMRGGFPLFNPTLTTSFPPLGNPNHTLASFFNSVVASSAPNLPVRTGNSMSPPSANPFPFTTFSPPGDNRFQPAFPLTDNSAPFDNDFSEPFQAPPSYPQDTQPQKQQKTPSTPTQMQTQIPTMQPTQTINLQAILNSPQTGRKKSRSANQALSHHEGLQRFEKHGKRLTFSGEPRDEEVKRARISSRHEDVTPIVNETLDSATIDSLFSKILADPSITSLVNEADLVEPNFLFEFPPE